jgi:hypothetical protein
VSNELTKLSADARGTLLFLCPRAMQNQFREKIVTYFFARLLFLKEGERIVLSLSRICDRIEQGAIVEKHTHTGSYRDRRHGTESEIITARTGMKLDVKMCIMALRDNFQLNYTSQVQQPSEHSQVGTNTKMLIIEMEFLPVI